MASQSTAMDRINRLFLAGKMQMTDAKNAILKSKPEDWTDGRNPNYPKGDNQTRQAGFTYSYTHHKKGIYFQQIIKPAILTMVNFAHNGMKHIYDQDIFKYDDPQLQKIDAFATDYIKMNFADMQYKTDVMMKVKDIILGIMKEDPFYSSAGYQFFNQFIKAFPNGFEMTQAQKDNREQANTREYFCGHCKTIHKGVPPFNKLDQQGNLQRNPKTGQLLLSCNPNF